MLGAMTRTGFTVVEVMVALVVFAIGALGFAAEIAVLTRLLAQGHRAATVTQAAATRLERLQANGCRSRADGGETLKVNSVPIAEIAWHWSDPGDSTYGLTLRTAPFILPGTTRVPTDTFDAVLWCRR
jgi:prepilin-type N-terminal cleavage/methylation domain-containing protein